MKKFAKDRRFLLGLVIVLPITFLAILQPILPLPDPNKTNIPQRLAKPSKFHPLGTDEYGRDLFVRLLVGTRTSIAISFGATVLAALTGTLIGIISACSTRFVETIAMRTVDIILAFPPIVLATVVVGLFGNNILNLVLTLGLLNLPGFARLAYGSTKIISSLAFIEAARAIGMTTYRLMLKHIVPNIVSPLFVQFSLTVGSIILLESGLSFLGIGVKPPTASLGQIIGRARGYMALSPSYVLWPAVLLSLIILSFNLLGDAARDYMDPKITRLRKP
ncbi:MAG: ABC transporter permease [Candidatus Methanomethyliaceae archaeon]